MNQFWVWVLFSFTRLQGIKQAEAEQQCSPALFSLRLCIVYVPAGGEGEGKSGHVAVFQRRHKKFIKINCKVNKQVAEAFVAVYACSAGSIRWEGGGWQGQLALNTPLTA